MKDENLSFTQTVEFTIPRRRGISRTIATLQMWQIRFLTLVIHEPMRWQPLESQKNSL
nr:MAG TPA: hypothetical protein [Caudoviricetes sp.]DAI24762.1 MAG TPA: hypothetical protein [Caudoviricetes sp.]